MEKLGYILRGLIVERKITQKQLAKDVGMSQIALSQIINGKAKPRQLNLSRIMKLLCVNADEEQEIIAAYERIENKLSDSPTKADTPIPEDEYERVSRYMEVKALSIGFQREVEKALQKLDCNFAHPYTQGSTVCDFFISSPVKIAIDCKFNVNRDWDRTVITAELLQKKLLCDKVFIVVPSSNNLSCEAVKRLQANQGIYTLEQLNSHLAQTISSKSL